MRIRLKPWLALAILAAVLLAITAGVDYYRHRFVRSDADLFRFLPQRDATLFYVNVGALRHAGMLQLLAGTKRVEERAYREFMQRTGFDYTKDLDALAGSTDATQTFCVVRGRFDWNKLRGYSGTCLAGVCEMPGSQSDHWISFREIQPDVMGLAISADHRAAGSLHKRHSASEDLPHAAIWISLSRSLLSNPGSLPLAARLFAISLETAHPVILSLSSNGAAADTPFQLVLDARCANPAAADTIRNQLELDTKMLQLGLAREHIPTNPADLTGLLTAGSFQIVESRVVGSWPIRKQLIDALQ